MAGVATASREEVARLEESCRRYKPGEKFIVQYHDEMQWRELYYLLPCTPDSVWGPGQSYVLQTDGSYTLATHSSWYEHMALDPNSLDYPAHVGSDDVSAFAETPSDELLSTVIRGAIVDRNAKDGQAGYENMVALPETRLNPMGIQVALPLTWHLIPGSLSLGRAPPPPAVRRAAVQFVSSGPPAVPGSVWVVSEIIPSQPSSLGTVVVREEIVAWHEDRGVADVLSLSPGAPNYIAAVRRIADSDFASFVSTERAKYANMGQSATSGLMVHLGVGPDAYRRLGHSVPAQQFMDATGQGQLVDGTDVWVVAFSSSDEHPVGSIVPMCWSDLSVGVLGIWSDHAGVDFFVERIKVTDLVGYAERRVIVPPGDVAMILPPDDSARTEENVSDEVRTLWIDTNDQQERFKEWWKVCAESTDSAWPQRFVDWPLEGPSTALFWCKYTQRFGGNPRLWLAEFIRTKGLATVDRSVRELTFLCDVMWYAGTYDQLNVGGLAALEAVVRRINDITDDLAARGGTPNWRGAKFFSGTSSIDDGVCPARRFYVARRQREVEGDWSLVPPGGGQGDGAEVGLPGLGEDGQPKGDGKGK